MFTRSQADATSTFDDEIQTRFVKVFDCTHGFLFMFVKLSILIDFGWTENPFFFLLYMLRQHIDEAIQFSICVHVLITVQWVNITLALC